ncbi:helix-turn-helix domain-containing protein [Breznakiellaceae bacterium SP9]
MPRYNVTLTEEERNYLEDTVQRAEKGYRIKHAQILLKLDKTPENKVWTYDLIQSAYNTTRATIAGVAKRFVEEGIEAAIGRKPQSSHVRKVTDEVEAKMIAIACSAPPEGRSRWTMQLIADKLIELQVVEYITDSTVCETLKKAKLSRVLPDTRK